MAEKKVEKEEHNLAYLEKIECMNKEVEIIELKHKYKMEELAFERENSRRFHDQELEKIRIKSAEIRRSQERQWKP